MTPRVTLCFSRVHHVPSVLVVDDDADIRQFMRLILEDQGYRVLDAGDGLEALNVLRDAPQPVVVITNHRMPRLDGPGLISAARQDPVLSTRCAFIYMTAHGAPTSPDLQQILEEARAPVLLKPFDLKDLLAAVESAAERLSPVSNTNGTPSTV